MQSDNLMYDLHGLSEEDAEALVLSAIRHTHGNNNRVLRFITGRGNHVNSKGNRGTLFTEFPNWIKRSQFADRIAKVDCFDGHYEVHIKSVQIDNRVTESQERFTKKLLSFSFPEVKKDALAQDPQAMCIYASYLEQGELCQRNVKLAAQFLEKSANAGWPIAMHEYARFWLHGIGVRQSDERAQFWLWKAHEKGVIHSTVTLAKSYAMALPGYEYDIQKAIELHQIAARAGVTDSMRFFGTIHRDGSGGYLKSSRLSFAWYKKAADKGDAKAQFNMGVMYQKGEGVEADQAQSAHYFELSAKGGDSDAQFMHALNLLNTNTKLSKQQGIMWLFTAADNGSEHANQHIAKLLKNSDNEEYLIRSANAGNFYSQIKLDKLKGIDRSLENIPSWEVIAKFKTVSENGLKLMTENARYFMLDRVLLHAKAKHKRKAYRYIEEMAESKCEFAMRRMVYFFKRGDSALHIKKNHMLAVEWLNKAVDLKDPFAMVELALVLQKSDQVNNRTKIKKLLRQAAEAKYPPGCYYLGQLYEQGYYGDDKIREAIQCYKLAIKHEVNVSHLNQLILGPLDEYAAVTDMATHGINRLAPLVTSTSRSDLNQSALQRGFWVTESVAEEPIKPHQEAQPVHHSNEDDTVDAKEEAHNEWSCVLQ